MQEKDTQVYEVGFHILPTVEEGRLSEVLVRLKDMLVGKGANITSEDFPKLRQLAYSMTKESQGKNQAHSKAYFGSIKFEASKEAVAEINGAVNADPDILRYLIVKTVKENTIYYSKNLEAAKEEGESKVEEKPAKEMSTEEIDKSIEELVIN